MPLKFGHTKAIISNNIREMMNSTTFAKDKDKKKRQQMAVAAALSKSREKK